ncbi:MAG: hypothetical protein M3Y71_05345 [Actinomycetota bacterium]|nr:hypothetical protein [Actinomycetota bacterium]
MSATPDSPTTSTRTMRDRKPATAADVTRVAVPTLTFWVAKALSTAMGESVSDWSIHAAPAVLAVLLALVAFVAALAVQLTRHRYLPWVYWTAVAMVGVFGTMAADVAHVVLGLPYAVSFLLCAALLGGLFAYWRRSEGSCDVHEVTTTRRELLYWAAVVLTFAMGTALGDLMAVTLHLGYALSVVLFAVAILVPVLGYRLMRWDPVFSFWLAYVLTRPLGASVADWLGKPVAAHGVGLGSGWVGLTLAALMALTVATMRATPWRQIQPRRLKTR